MTIMQTIKDERGFALVLALVVMAAMTAIGVAAVTSSTTDLMIARNEKEAKVAFYLAETGIEEAIARVTLKDTNDRYMGETYTMTDSKRDDRLDVSSYDAGSIVQAPAGFVLGKSFSSHGVSGDELNIPNFGGTYEVTVEYTRENDTGKTWCRGTCDTTDEIVMFCYTFISGNTPVDCETGFPVYEITSIGTTTGGTSAKIISYVSAAALNLMPPGDTILFTEEEIVIGGGPDASIEGKVASYSYSQNPVPDVDNDEIVGCDDPCDNVSNSGTEGVGSWIPPYAYDSLAEDNEGAMADYLGMSIDTLKGYADVSDINEGVNTRTITSGDYPSPGFGEMCSTDRTGADADGSFDSHICDKDPQVIVLDNYDETNHKSYGSFKMTGETGRGLLIVTGDLDISGNFTWEGMIFVMGQLKLSGNPVVYGTIMVEGDGNADAGNSSSDVSVSGSLKVFGSRPVAASVAIGMSVPKMLRWTRL